LHEAFTLRLLDAAAVNSRDRGAQVTLLHPAVPDERLLYQIGSVSALVLGFGIGADHGVGTAGGLSPVSSGLSDFVNGERTALVDRHSDAIQQALEIGRELGVRGVCLVVHAGIDHRAEAGHGLRPVIRLRSAGSEEANADQPVWRELVALPALREQH
jgi:hypothetical protein